MVDTRIYNEGKPEMRKGETSRQPISFSGDPHSSKTGKINTNPRIDDLIISLENAYENRRACQVTKWENMHHQHFQISV
ncbi:MAG: hypothetical protein ABIV48_06380 [Pyrinomonadaceae bacterium]